MKRSVYEAFVGGRPLAYVVEVDLDGAGRPIGVTARLRHGIHGSDPISDEDLVALVTAYGLPST